MEQNKNIMTDFQKALDLKIRQSIKNNHGVENYDEFRFGKLSVNNSIPVHKPINLKKELKNIIKNILGYDPYLKVYKADGRKLIAPYEVQINTIWNNISKLDKDLLVSLIAYRVLGYKKVKLPRNNQAYWEAIEKAIKLSNKDDTYDPNFMHFILDKFDLKPIGFDIEFYFSEIGVAIDFIIEQYSYKVNGKDIVAVEKGDVVLDVGACWGDTAMYFASKTGSEGKVFSFEFIPNNIKLFKLNISFNPTLIDQIELVSQPVSDNSGQTIYFKDHGPGSIVKFEPFLEQSGSSTTVSIDDFVKSKHIKTIDFIKMDIEGAETLALEGAIETIKKFRPKLAIAIYHSMDDFFNIPNWILSLNLDYEIFIGHYTIHAEETICFAKPRIKS